MPLRLATSLLAFVMLACSGVSAHQHLHGPPDATVAADGGGAMHDGAVDAAADADLGYDAALPSENAPRGHVRGVVYGVAQADLGKLRVSAGSSAVTVADTGFFYLDDALAGPHTHVIGTVPGYSAGHAFVPVSSGETANVILWLVPLQKKLLTDLPAAQSLPLGAKLGDGQLELAQGVLQTVYGTPVRGTVQVESAALSATTAPGGTWAEVAGKREPFARLGMIEVRAVQTTAQLALKSAATLSFAIGTPRNHRGDAQVQVYRFDERAAVFRPFALVPFVATAHAVSVKITELGIYAAGEPLGDQGCAKLVVADAAGAPIPHAALLYGSNDFGNQLVTDAQGQACLVADVDAALRYRAFGRTDAGLVEVIPTSDARVSDTVLACGATACAQLGLAKGVAPQIRCVRGKIAEAHAPSEVFVSLDSTLPPHLLHTGDSFCFDARAPTQVGFDSLVLQCGAAQKLKPSTKPSTCAEDDCVQLTTVQCCSGQDLCDDGVDDDCDGIVDEGCDCGGEKCMGPRGASGYPGYCCTSAKQCGLRPVGRDQCFESEAVASPDVSCPQEVITGSFRTGTLLGCCRADNRCGLQDTDFGCVAREDAQALFELASPLTGQACTY